MFAESVNAMAGTGQGTTTSGAAGLTSLLPIVLMIIIFYLLLIRPQMRERKKHQEMLNNLQRGDRIITSGGILGSIVNVSDTTFTIDVGNKVRMEVLKSAVQGIQSSSEKEDVAK